jgi:sugar/nucleoside kinase (ribokinase family)
MSILVIGSVALDSVKTPFGERREVLGGSATYFSVSASFFTKVNLVAVVGNDFPKRYIDFLRNRNIDLKGLEIKPGKTFRWKGEYGYDLNEAKTIDTRLNVFSKFHPWIPEEYKNSQYVFLANIDPVIQRMVLKQIRNSRLVACDTMNYWIENKRNELIELLKEVDLILLNDSEARLLSGQANLMKAARTIIAFGPKSIIIKKGEHGCLFFSKRSIFCIPAYMLESVYDPTGAGDTFAGGFMGYLAKLDRLSESNIRRAIVYGSIMASYVVEDFSLERLAKLIEKDIHTRFREFKKITHF